MNWEMVYAFVRHLLTRFVEDACLRAAASLAYTTLLSLVPLMAVMFVILTAFPAFDEIGVQIEQALFNSLVPGTSSAILEHLHTFSSKAAGLGIVGVLFLIFTALSMMSTIESTFNVIWRVRDKRSALSRFLIFWAILTLGPMLIGAGFVATTYVVSLPLVNEFDQHLDIKDRLIGFLPALTASAAFALLYMLVPNRRVSIRHAAIGGIVAGILFELAKRGFAYYVTHFPTQQAIYGAFASVPIFLLWIYVSWVITLLGAEITRCLSTFSSVRGGYWTRNRFYILYRVMGHFWLRQQHGGGLRKRDILQVESGFSDTDVDDVLDLLEQRQWIGYLKTDRMALLIDLETVTVADLWALIPDAPNPAQPVPESEAGWNRRLADLMQHQHDLFESRYRVSLASMYRQEAAEEQSEGPPEPAPLEEQGV